LPDDGVRVHGMYVDGFRWETEQKLITDSIPVIMNGVLPIF